MPKFKTQRNWLTPYALDCGYEETAKDSRYSLNLFQYGATKHYNVRLHDHETGKRICWETFQLLTNARSYFGKWCIELGLKKV